jgi:hypothetical protein
LEIGEGIILPKKVFHQYRIGNAKDSNRKSVFNVTSITQKVLLFSLSS